MALLRCPRRPHPPTPLSLKGEGGSEKSGLSRSPPPSPFRERGAGGVRSAGKAERQKPVEHPLARRYPKTAWSASTPSLAASAAPAATSPRPPFTSQPPSTASA